jgi:hypothetical protein
VASYAAEAAPLRNKTDQLGVPEGAPLSKTDHLRALKAVPVQSIKPKKMSHEPRPTTNRQRLIHAQTH